MPEVKTPFRTHCQYKMTNWCRVKNGFSLLKNKEPIRSWPGNTLYSSALPACLPCNIAKHILSRSYVFKENSIFHSWLYRKVSIMSSKTFQLKWVMEKKYFPYCTSHPSITRRENIERNLDIHNVCREKAAIYSE